MSLSDATIRSLEPPEKGQKLYTDPTLAGFAVRVSAGGAKSFILQVGTERRKITIGRYPIISLSKAREEAKRLLAEHTLGKVRPQSITFPEALELFVAEKRKSRKSRTADDYNDLLKRFTYKGQMADLSHQETVRRLDRFKAPSTYNHTLIALRVFCNWCMKRRYITENPTMGLSAHYTQPRSRVLTDAELQLIWRACEQTGDGAGADLTSSGRNTGNARLTRNNVPPRLPAHFATIVRLLICTGQRRGEIAALRAEYCDLNCADRGSAPSMTGTAQCTITLPATLTKNGREHTFPIGLSATQILKPYISGSGLLFPARGKDTPFNGWSKAKAQLDQLSGTSDWTLHDIRRTVATRLASMGTAPHVVERLLNHVSGQISGVAAIYNRASYLEEMRTAVTLWENHLNKLLAT